MTAEDTVKYSEAARKLGTSLLYGFCVLLLVLSICSKFIPAVSTAIVNASKPIEPPAYEAQYDMDTLQPIKPGSQPAE